MNFFIFSTPRVGGPAWENPRYFRGKAHSCHVGARGQQSLRLRAGSTQVCIRCGSGLAQVSLLWCFLLSTYCLLLAEYRAAWHRDCGSCAAALRTERGTRSALYHKNNHCFQMLTKFFADCSQLLAWLGVATSNIFPQVFRAAGVSHSSVDSVVVSACRYTSWEISAARGGWRFP